MTTDSSVEIPSGRNHVCAFFSTMDESKGASRVLQRGLRPGRKGHTHSGWRGSERYIKRLAETGIKVEELMAAGQLEVLPWTDMYVRDHHFDQDAMLDSVEELIDRAHMPATAYQAGRTSYGMVVCRQTSREQLGRVRGAPEPSSFQIRKSGDL